MRKFFLATLAVIVFVSTQAQVFSLLKDINSGTPNSSPTNFEVVNNQLFFQADNGINGKELWKSDGTEAGTVMIKDINPGIASSHLHADDLVVMNGIAFFTADDGVHGVELWKSDGTEAGTVMVRDINSGSTTARPLRLTQANSTLYFTVSTVGFGEELWKSDGTEVGTVLVKDIFAGATSSTPYSLTEFNGMLFFGAEDGIHTGGLLWKTDGTSAGTVIVKDFSPLPVVQQLKKSGALLFITAGNNPSGELWKSDGTEAGTAFVKGSLFPDRMCDVNGTLFFQGGADAAYGIELWKSDGTETGTAMVRDIRTGPASSTPIELKNINGTLYFLARNSSVANLLWRSDGTEAGTELVVNFQSGSASNVNGIAYFSADDGTHGREIWKCDGTLAGTSFVQDIVTGSGHSDPAFFTVVGTKIFASIGTPENGRELWAANIPSAGTLPLTLLDFNAKLSGSDGLLNWKTASEQNTSHFEIERSTDGRNFAKSGTVTAAANSTATKQYGYSDGNITSLGAPVIYYRLKMNDADGKFTYSKIIAINISSKEAVVMLYPNPAQENAILMIAAVKKENITYRIIDQGGRTMQQKNITVNEGSNMLTLEIAKLTAGVYTIILRGENVNNVLKLVKE